MCNHGEFVVRCFCVWKGSPRFWGLRIFEHVPICWKFNIDLEPQTTKVLRCMEMVKFNHFLGKDLVHHPIETTILYIFWGVPGVPPSNHHILKELHLPNYHFWYTYPTVYLKPVCSLFLAFQNNVVSNQNRCHLGSRYVKFSGVV